MSLGHLPGDESYALEKLLDDDKDAALDIDVQGVVEEIDPKGTDDETDASRQRRDHHRRRRLGHRQCARISLTDASASLAAS